MQACLHARWLHVIVRLDANVWAVVGHSLFLFVGDMFWVRVRDVLGPFLGRVLCMLYVQSCVKTSTFQFVWSPPRACGLLSPEAVRAAESRGHHPYLATDKIVLCCVRMCKNIFRGATFTEQPSAYHPSIKSCPASNFAEDPPHFIFRHKAILCKK